MSDIEKLGFIEEPAEEYHAKRGYPFEEGKYHTSHLNQTLQECPLLYWQEAKGLIVKKDRPAYVEGRAAHTLILEGREAYKAEYAFGGPVNPKTGAYFGSQTKAFKEWAEEQGKPVLTDSQDETAEMCYAGVQQNAEAVKLLSVGVAEAVIRVDLCGVPCQTRMDWFNPEAGLVDLKTCDNLKWFEADARRYGYPYQLAFYRSALEAHLGERGLPVYLIAVEKQAPNRCGVWRVGNDILGHCEKENEQTLAFLKACHESGEWPTGYEDIRTFDHL